MNTKIWKNERCKLIKNIAKTRLEKMGKSKINTQ